MNIQQEIEISAWFGNHYEMVIERHFHELKVLFSAISLRACTILALEGMHS